MASNLFLESAKIPDASLDADAIGKKKCGFSQISLVVLTNLIDDCVIGNPAGRRRSGVNPWTFRQWIKQMPSRRFPPPWSVEYSRCYDLNQSFIKTGASFFGETGAGPSSAGRGRGSGVDDGVWRCGGVPASPKWFNQVAIAAILRASSREQLGCALTAC